LHAYGIYIKQEPVLMMGCHHSNVIFFSYRYQIAGKKPVRVVISVDRHVNAGDLSINPA